MPRLREAYAWLCRSRLGLSLEIATPLCGRAITVTHGDAAAFMAISIGEFPTNSSRSIIVLSARDDSL
jgi:hypothetical protein